jgi:hypothetical protein
MGNPACCSARLWAVLTAPSSQNRCRCQRPWASRCWAGTSFSRCWRTGRRWRRCCRCHSRPWRLRSDRCCPDTARSDHCCQYACCLLVRPKRGTGAAAVTAPMGLLPCATLRCAHTAALTSLRCEDLNRRQQQHHGHVTMTSCLELNSMQVVHRAFTRQLGSPLPSGCACSCGFA